MDYINVLLVEDEKNISDVINAYLIKENFNVFLANDGQKALDLFRNNIVDSKDRVYVNLDKIYFTNTEKVI